MREFQIVGDDVYLLGVKVATLAQPGKELPASLRERVERILKGDPLTLRGTHDWNLYNSRDTDLVHIETNLGA